MQISLVGVKWVPEKKILWRKTKIYSNRMRGKIFQNNWRDNSPVIFSRYNL
jgi:hypothetical protein